MDSVQALKVVSKFFPLWSKLNPDQVTVSSVTGGLMNTVYLVEGPKCKKDAVVPQRMIIRQFGGGLLHDPSIDDRRNSPVEENIICFQTSNLGIGPQMYGISKDGRIEEFVQSHTLRPSEVLDPQIRKDLAHTFATFHSMKIPLSEDKLPNYINHVRYLFDNLFKDRQQRQAIVPEDKVDDEDWNLVLDFDYSSELEWLLKVLDKIKSRTVLLLNDDNYLNLLVREDAQQGKSNIAIIDYEWAMNGPRCIDLGSLFVNQMIDWSKGIAYTGYEILSEVERCHYIREYISKLRQLNTYSNLDPEGLDSLGHVVQEADLGILLYLVMFSSLVLYFASNDTKFSLGPPLFLTNYLKYRENFLSKYPAWSKLRN